MRRPYPVASDDLTALGQIIFGGHQVDRDEREAWLQLLKNPRRGNLNPISSKLGPIWAEAGGTGVTLEQSWHQAQGHFNPRRPRYDYATTQKRKLDNEYRSWRPGGASSSSSTSWRSNQAWSDAGTTSNQADSQASSSRGDGQDRVPAGQWVPKKAKEEQQQGSQ